MSQSPQRFSVKEIEFGVAEASLACSIIDPYWSSTYNRGRPVAPLWSLSCSGGKKEIGGEVWDPRAYHETLPLAVRDWREIGGQTITWSEAYDDEEEPNGGFYVFEHHEIADGVIRFLDRSGDLLRLEWSGHCDIHFDEDFDVGVPFRIEAAAKFEGLLVQGSEKEDEASIRARAAAHLDLGGFDEGTLEPGSSRYEDGVLMVACRFRPRG